MLRAARNIELQELFRQLVAQHGYVHAAAERTVLVAEIGRNAGANRRPVDGDRPRGGSLAAAGRLPKAVVLVHLYGQSADLDPIVARLRARSRSVAGLGRCGFATFPAGLGSRPPLRLFGVGRPMDGPLAGRLGATLGYRSGASLPLLLLQYFLIDLFWVHLYSRQRRSTRTVGRRR